MLEIGLFAIHLAEFSRRGDADTVLDMGTVNPARILRLEGYGLNEGCHANFNIVDAADAYEAFRLNADRRYAVRHGRIVAETRTTSFLHLP